MATTQDGAFRFVGASFKPDGSGRLYTYKIPADWRPTAGQMMKVPAPGALGHKLVKIMDTDAPDPGPTRWEIVIGSELVQPDAAAIPEADDDAAKAARRRRYLALKDDQGVFGLVPSEEIEFAQLRMEFEANPGGAATGHELADILRNGIGSSADGDTQ